MPDKQLTIVTTTFNCRNVIEGYIAAVEKLNSSRFDWVVLDAASSDGTAEYLRERADGFSYFNSEADAGFYYGLNKALAQVRTPYYMVFGADDRPSPELLDYVEPLLLQSPAAIFGAVRIMPAGVVKQAGPRWWHPVVWARAVSHHSVGTVIRTSLHERFGRYDTGYILVADGAFLKRILMSDELVLRSKCVFGEFELGGMSSKLALRSILETFMLQYQSGSGFFLQFMLMSARLIKGWLSGAFSQHKGKP